MGYNFSCMIASDTLFMAACVADADIVFVVAICNMADHYIFALWFLSFFFLLLLFFLA